MKRSPRRSVSRRVTRPLPSLPDLPAELVRLLMQVPRGSVTTFGSLALGLGDRHAAIWVSQWLHGQSPTKSLPVHRVVRKDGGLIESDQRRRLADENVTFVKDPTLGRDRVSDATPRLSGFSGSRPLVTLKEWQREIRDAVQDVPLPATPRTVAGIDVAYPSPDVAAAAGVLMSVDSQTVLAEVTVEVPISFPYMPGFLTFREVPAMVAAWSALCELGPTPDVVMIDGNGRLHPERSGVATGFAAVTGTPTIGIAKSLLCGRVDKNPLKQRASATQVRPVLDGDERLGCAIQGRASAKPIYVSAGGWIILQEAIELTLSMLDGSRLPGPTHRADVLSKKVARGRRRDE